MAENESRNFIEEIIEEDLSSGRVQEVITRFPPEPNGYLHIGHAKSICLNFGIAKKYGGICNLRYDDTNPVKEDQEYIDAIENDVSWLGFKWAQKYFASDYFDYMFECAVKLIKKGLAYVCELSADEIREYRGTLKEPGRESPYRNRSIEENLKLFSEMKEGKYADGQMVLRAKIDMSSPNLNMRDPVLYRIMHASHHRTGDGWCIYPMYDFAHPLEDALEKISHSLCTLEFEAHRPLYDWCIENCDCVPPPRQYEFARLNLTQTIMSKRYLKKLVDEGMVDGWDDPRMPTICALRRRGYTPEAIRDFCDRIGIAKANSEVEAALLEHCVREDLNAKAKRIMAVLNPVRLVIDNYPEGKTEMLEAENLPGDENAGTRLVPFSREIYIEKEDFMEDPPKKFFRLAPGTEVRLKYAYIIRCESVIKDEKGEIMEIHCSYDPESKSGGATAGRKVKGTLHWAEVSTAVKAEVRKFDYLLLPEEDNEKKDFSERLNPASKEVLENALIEPEILKAKKGEQFQFMRQGYYCLDTKDTTDTKLVFNQIVGLKDSFTKAIAK